MTEYPQNRKGLSDWINDSIKASSERGYYPTEFIKMREKYRDDVMVIKRLMENSEIQSGFQRLDDLGLADKWSMEVAVFLFSDLFPPKTKTWAEYRLGLIGIEPPRTTNSKT